MGQIQVKAVRENDPHLFLCILVSFFCPVRPTLPRAIFFPKIPSFWTSDLLFFFLIEKRQAAGAGFWGRFWTGSPHRKKGKIPFCTRAKKGENQTCTELRSTISRHLLPPISRWGKTVDSYRRSCRNSRTSHRKGRFLVPEKGQFRLGKRRAKATQNGKHDLVHV